jgi:uncharacterized membrane protein
MAGESVDSSRGRGPGLLARVYTFNPRDQAVHPAGRLAGFTDAILAIAATLTVLNLTTALDRPGNSLAHQLDAQKAVLLSTLLGFMWITGAWVLSHRALRQLRGADHYLTLLVIARSLVITLIPFATSLLARGFGHDDFWVGVEAIAIVIFIESIFAASCTYYAHRRHLNVATASPAERAFAMRVWFVVIAAVVVACVSAPWSPWFALAIVVLTRVSSVLPVGADRRGLFGDVGTAEEP